MEKRETRASELLSSISEIGGMNYEKTVQLVAALMSKAKFHRDLRAPAEAINTFCKKSACNVQTLETMLNQIGYVLMQRHGWSFEEAEAALNELVQKMVAIGRMRHGRT